jgi:AraC-like DNA-binding protein
MPEAIPNSAAPWQEVLIDDLLESMRVRSSHFLRMRLGAPWGIRVESADLDTLLELNERQPHAGIRASSFHIVSEGSCSLEVQGVPGRTGLQVGDFAVLPRGDPHILRDGPGDLATGILELVQASRRPSNGEIRVGSDAAATRLVCGGVLFDNVKTNPLLAALPPVIHVSATENEDGISWLHLTVQHVIDELDSSRAGVHAVVGRLADILFIGAVRSYITETLVSAESGWLAAVRDPQIGRAVAVLHSEPWNPWTVDLIADRVGLSRSAFASKFTQLVGEPPLRYLTSVRLDLAAKRLRTTRDKLPAIAAAAGYDSPSAFTRAFERHVGTTPGEYRRTYLE